MNKSMITPVESAQMANLAKSPPFPICKLHWIRIPIGLKKMGWISNLEEMWSKLEMVI